MPADNAALKPTEFLDYESAPMRAFVDAALPADDRRDLVEKATALYYAVRDGIRYDVYDADLSRNGLTASAILERGSGFCLHKSIVYAAAVRAAGIPSRLVYGDVRNHLASPRLRDLIGGDVFFHGLVSVYLNGTWIKATPVFNNLLCRLYGIKPLDFDGRTDSLYHPYDENGRRHMEFLRMHGEYDDVPYDMVIDRMKTAHPRLFAGAHTTAAGSLVAEANFQQVSGDGENQALAS